MPNVVVNLKNVTLYGYTIRDEDLTFLPSFDIQGQVMNPDTTLQLHNLCSLCKNQPQYEHHRTELDLRKAILWGCHICTLFWSKREHLSATMQASYESKGNTSVTRDESTFDIDPAFRGVLRFSNVGFHHLCQSCKYEQSHETEN